MIALAVDGGGFKTDLALVRSDGELLSLVRGPMSSPHHVGLDGCIEVIDGLLAEAVAGAGLDAGARPLTEVAHVLMAGADLPDEERELTEAVDASGWAAQTSAENDTFALLRAGSSNGWGVAVVCGAGFNCVGVSPDGRHARFLALGAITGDWGGGYDVGLAAQMAAARAADGRGSSTSLESAVPAHFGLTDPFELAEEIHRGRVAARRLNELPPVVFAESEHDEVAAGIVDRLAGEVGTFAAAAIERLSLQDEQVPVVLGGGVMRGAPARLIDVVAEQLSTVAPRARVVLELSPPIVGAALLGLDELGAGEEAQERVRREIEAAVARLGDGAAPAPAAVESGGPIDG
ncbi:MAG TPA: BadF/BadG/BcrA/BcrD ATPase family protein [Thermoleophilaceae bacterium]